MRARRGRRPLEEQVADPWPREELTWPPTGHVDNQQTVGLQPSQSLPAGSVGTMLASPSPRPGWGPPRVLFAQSRGVWLLACPREERAAGTSPKGPCEHFTSCPSLALTPNPPIPQRSAEAGRGLPWPSWTPRTNTQNKQPGPHPAQLCLVFVPCSGPWWPGWVSPPYPSVPEGGWGGASRVAGLGGTVCLWRVHASVTLCFFSRWP